MKLIIEQDSGLEEAEIVIRCSEIDSELRKIIASIRMCSFSVNAYRDGYLHKLDKEKICYIESVDEKVFAYCENEVYECKTKMQELESKLTPLGFVRISKACILNIGFIERVKPLLNGRYEVFLLNGERLIINRHYVSEFKKKFGF